VVVEGYDLFLPGDQNPFTWAVVVIDSQANKVARLLASPGWKAQTDELAKMMAGSTLKAQSDALTGSSEFRWGWGDAPGWSGSVVR